MSVIVHKRLLAMGSTLQSLRRDVVSAGMTAAMLCLAGWVTAGTAVIASETSQATTTQTSNDQEPADPDDEAAGEDVVGARVGDHEIRLSDVKRHLEPRLQHTTGWESEPIVLALGLQHLVQRELVHQHFEQSGRAAGPAQIRLRYEQLRESLEALGTTLESWREQQRLSESQLQRQLAWEIAWNQYLQRHLTDENLRVHFERHRQRFDGTRVRVAHILLRPAPSTEPSEMASLVEKLQGVAERIRDGELEWREAVEQFSQAASAEDGGEIGWISRHEPMPEPFSAAAFELARGDISEPVVTAFGVHLIQSLEIEPGPHVLEDVKEQVRRDAAAWLFQWTAERAADVATVEYTGLVPTPENLGIK